MLRVDPMALPAEPGSEARPRGVSRERPARQRHSNLTAIQRTIYEDSFLHTNPYPNTAAPGQPGVRGRQRGLPSGVNGPNQQAIGNPPNAADRATEKTAASSRRRAGR